MEKKQTMKRMKKQVIIAIVTVAILSMYVPTVYGATAVTGTFTPVPTGISISVNQTAPAFGNINLGSSAENLSINVTNDGDVNCSVTMTAEQGPPGNWTLVAGTSSPATHDQYCLNMKPADASYLDVYTEQTVINVMTPQGGGLWHVKVDLKLILSDWTNEVTPEEQTIYANMTAAAATP